MIGFLGGTGPEGGCLALRMGLAGESITIGSRDVARAREAAGGVRSLGGLALVEAGLNEDVARNADVVFITVPYFALRSLLEPLRDILEGKIVVSTVVPVIYSDWRFTGVAVEEGSAAQEAQAILPRSRVVAAFQTISALDLADLTKPVEGDVVTCSDDQQAKELVMSLVERIPSLRAIDGGGLENSRYVEGMTTLLLNLNHLYRTRSAIRIVGI